MDTVHRLAAEGRLGVGRPIQPSWVSLFGFARYSEDLLFPSGKLKVTEGGGDCFA